MRANIRVCLLIVAAGLLLVGSAAGVITNEGDDPDRPRFAGGTFDEANYLKLRAEYIARLRGYEPGKAFDIGLRKRAIDVMAGQESDRNNAAKTSLMQPQVFDWTPIGPTPIPNGQTQTTTAAVSGRVTAIDVKPTNSAIAYVGTADGGVYRTLDSGATWTQLMSTAQSLAIGAITIDPVTPTTVFVGTGEGNLALDNFFGVGIYRIITAETTPTVQGPFETRTGSAATTHAFLGTGITKIIIDPANNNNMYVGNTLSGSGLNGEGITAGLNAAFIGLYFSSNAQAGTPTWVRVTGLPFFFLTARPPPRSTLFPYTLLVQSASHA